MSSDNSTHEKDAVSHGDLEKQAPAHSGEREHGIRSILHVKKGEVYEIHAERHPKWYQRLLDHGVEENGVKPVPFELRTSRQYNNIFTVFFTCLLCLLPIPTGALATVIFGMSLRDSALVILFFATLTSIPPAFMGVAGYKTGLRQMVHARYSWGLYIVTIPIILNAATITGFSLISAIVGGQTIAAVNPGAHISVDLGIVIICLVSFLVAFLGYKPVHIWERYQWIPNLIVIVITVGCGGKHLWKQAEVPPATAPQIISYGGLMAGYFLTFGGTVSDYSIYHHPDAPKRKIFAYLLAAFVIPSVPLLILGAAIGGAIPSVPEWSAAYADFGIGGVMAEMLSPAKGFGKFVLVLLALSVIGNITISMYSVALCLQTIIPLFAKIHRFIWVIVVIAVMIPLAIEAAKNWERSLENFLGLIGYWAGCFDAVLIEELVIFRKMDWSSFDHKIWNVGRDLPTGIPAIAASLISMALVIPGMAAVWYTGPIAKTTGDIGFEMAFVVTGIFYVPLRWLEIKIRGHL